MNDQQHSRPDRWVFWTIYAIVAVLLCRQVVAVADLSALMINDDLMRLVEVRDWLAGQRWDDLMQYRMGLEGGTLMHWSRLVDAPIGALIWLAARVLPMAQAEMVAMVVWPLALAGVLLAILQKGGTWLAGAAGGVFALALGAIALLATQKFDVGSFDHHSVQLVVVMLALAALVSPMPSLKLAAVSGAASAASIVVGFEAIIFIAIMAGYVAIMWMLDGRKAQAQALGFSLSFAAVLGLAFWLLRPDFSATVFRCDAFGPEIVRVGLTGALGLAALVAIGGRAPLLARVVGILALAGAVFAVAFAYSPSCLANPLDQLYPDVAEKWLAIIVEAQGLLSYVRSHAGGNAGLLVSPLVVMVLAAGLALDRRFTARAVLMLVLVAVAYGLTLYQIREMTFLTLLGVFPAATMLARIYKKYRAGSQIAGLAVLAGLMLVTPDIPSVAYGFIARTPSPAESPQGAATARAGEACKQPSAFAEFSQAPVGLVLTSSNLGVYVLAFTPHRALVTNFHRDQDGIQAGIDLARAPLAALPELLRQTGVDYVAYCQNGGSLNTLASQFPDGIWAQIRRGDIPDFLHPLTTGPLLVYEVSDTPKDATQ